MYIAHIGAILISYHGFIPLSMARNLGWKMVVDSEQGRRLGAAAGGGGGVWGERGEVLLGACSSGRA